MTAQPASRADGLTDGYVTDIGYTFGHYPPLNPKHAELALLLSGVRPPKIETACELGFGQGVSLNIHVAASDVAWWGADIMPDHVAYARRLAAASGATPEISCEGFETYCPREDLPDFDFIAMHGVWSWVSAEHRARLVEFIDRKLRPGGVLYLCYNAMPGAAAKAALRELIIAQEAPAGASTEDRIAAALVWLEDLFAAEPKPSEATAAVRAEFERIRGRDPAYLAHEFFNANWLAMSFRELHGMLAPHGLTFVTTTERFGGDVWGLASKQRALLARTSDPVLHQTLKDHIGDTRFRPDYWVREPERLSGEARNEALRAARLVLLQPLATVSKSLRWLLNAAQPPKELYNRLLTILSTYRPMTIGDLETDEVVARFGFEALVHALTFMAEDRVVGLAQDDAQAARVRQRTDRLNRHILASPEPVTHLASPLTGSGVATPPEQRAWLRALHAGGPGVGQSAVDAAFLEAMMLT